MPILKLSCAKHPADIETKERLIQRLTQVVIEELQVPPASVNVLIELVDPAYWGVAGENLKSVFDREAQESRKKEG